MSLSKFLNIGYIKGALHKIIYVKISLWNITSTQQNGYEVYYTNMSQHDATKYLI